MDSKEPKLDFGPERPKKMLSWEGAFYIIWNWKTYAFYILWIFCSFMAFLDMGIGGIIAVTMGLWGVRLLGKLF